MTRRKKTSCHHFNGTIHDRCNAGILYRDVTTKPDEPGCAYRRPCIVLSPDNPHDAHGLDVRARTGEPGTCELFRLSTDEEIAEIDAAFEQAFQRHMKTIPLILSVKEEHGGKDWKGTRECPICGGVLHLTHAAYNGHVWGKCETENCVSWME